MAAAIAAQTAALTANMNAQFANVNAQLANMNAQLANMNARQSNATAVDQSDPITAIQDAAGNVAPDFPHTLGELNNLTPLQQSALLVFYNRQANPAASQGRRLKQLLGIRP